MFYSHEILTSREHGVATVWLVATLGAKSTTKKVNRKAILNVDVPRACNTIINPVSPMALRLQSNLLYGVSRVYREQCVYTLTDVQVLLDKMRTTLRVVRGMGLDPDAGKARPDQLILPYDPGFVPDLSLPGLDIDLSNLQSVSEFKTSGIDSSFLSSTMSNSSQINPQDLTIPELDISSSGFSFGDIGGLQLMSGALVDPAQRLTTQFPSRQSEYGNEGGVLLQPDFEFDEEGNIVDLFETVRRESPHSHRSLLPGGFEREGSMLHDFHLQWERRGDASADMYADEIMLVGDETEMLPEQSSTPKRNLFPDPDYEYKGDDASNSGRITMSLRKNIRRKIGGDEETKIPQAVLIQWNNEYLRLMQSAQKQKLSYRRVTEAKKNASSWVFEMGIGSVGVGMGASQFSHPLEAFSGESLVLALTGKNTVLPSKKRRFEHKGGDRNGRDKRVRRDLTDREQQVDLPRGVTQRDLDELMKDEVEVGRHAPPSLQDDMSSQMPWNITGSLQASRLGSASSIPHPFDSAGLSSHRQLPGLGRFSSRLPSASPLAGRSQLVDPGSLDRMSSLSIAGGDFFEGDPLINLDLDEDEMHWQHNERFGPLSAQRQVITQEESSGVHYQLKIQRALASLSVEDRNFFGFVDSYLKSVQPTAAVTFSKLLPPDTTTKAVATQGLVHLLTLANNGILKVDQSSQLLFHLDEEEEHIEFAEIYINIDC